MSTDIFDIKHHIQNEFFRLLQDGSPNDYLPNNLGKLYEEFASMLFAESYKLSLYNHHKALCYAKVEFTCLQNRNTIKQNREALQFVEKAILLIDIQIAFVEKLILSKNNSLPTVLQWQGSVMELVELIYALHEAGSFGNTSLKDLFVYIGKMFGCEISNYYRLFWDIRNRTAEERAYFLKNLTKTLQDKLNRMDGGARK